MIRKSFVARSGGEGVRVREAGNIVLVGTLEESRVMH